MFCCFGAADNPAGPAPITIKSYLFIYASSFALAPYWVSTTIPSFNGVMQVLTFGFPSTTITQSVQRPIAQKTPRGSWRFAV